MNSVNKKLQKAFELNNPKKIKKYFNKIYLKIKKLESKQNTNPDKYKQKILLLDSKYTSSIMALFDFIYKNHDSYPHNHKILIHYDYSIGVFEGAFASIIENYEKRGIITFSKFSCLSKKEPNLPNRPISPSNFLEGFCPLINFKDEPSSTKSLIKKHYFINTENNKPFIDKIC